jgi:hypothetical protein
LLKEVKKTMAQQDFEPDIIAQTENYGVWRSEEDEEELIFHIELGGITLHMTSEEWDEFVLLIKSAQG